MAKESNKSNNVKKDKKDSKNNFFKEFKAELKKVSWPTFKQLVNNTSAVIAIVLLTAVIVFILDVIFENVNKYAINGIRALVTSNQSSETDENENVSNEAAETNTVSEEGASTEGQTTDTNTSAEATNNVEGEVQENTTSEQ